MDEFAFDADNVALLLEILREREGKVGRKLHYTSRNLSHFHAY